MSISIVLCLKIHYKIIVRGLITSYSHRIVLKHSLERKWMLKRTRIELPPKRNVCDPILGTAVARWSWSAVKKNDDIAKNSLRGWRSTELETKYAFFLFTSPSYWRGLYSRLQIERLFLCTVFGVRELIRFRFPMFDFDNFTPVA